MDIPLNLNEKNKDLPRFRAMVVAPAHSGLLSTSGALYTFGSSYFGRLGLGVRQHQFIPKIVSLPSLVSVKMLAFGGNTSALLDQSGTVYTWGYNKVKNNQSNFTMTVWPMWCRPLERRSSSSNISQVSFQNYNDCHGRPTHPGSQY